MPLSDSPTFDAGLEDILPPDEPVSENSPEPKKPASRLRWVILGLVLVASVLAGVIFFAPGYGSVSGTVRDIDGNPIQADVSIAGIEGISRTNNSGQFLFSHVPSGAHTLAIHYQNDNISFEISIPKGGNFTIGQIQLVANG